MRARSLAVLSVLGAAALVAPLAALADNGGFTPQSARTPNAEGIDQTFWLLVALTGVIFVLVIGSLVLFIIRFSSRGRPREVEGPQIRGHTRLELAWTIGPVLIIATIATFVFVKLPSIDDPAAAPGAPRSKLHVAVKGYRFYWQFEYPRGVISIDTLHLPVGQVVDLSITAPASDVQHSWWVPKLGGKMDAIPGIVNHMRVRVDEPGTYVGQCAEFCGIQHAGMLARVLAAPRQEFTRWLSEQATEQRGKSPALGREIWHGACSKCHGERAGGGIGPRLVGNPLLGDRNGLEQLIREGRGKMPPVGPDWSDHQIDTLQAYVERQFAQQSGGGAGGG